MNIEKERLEWIASRSLVNCHTIGMDSILFDDTPGKRLRAFFANEDHELWKNGLPFEHELSVGLHSHHCAITLDPIFGTPYNVIESALGINSSWSSFKYQSKISTGKGGFVNVGELKKFRLAAIPLYVPWHMKASEIHTVYLPKGKIAAWFVREHADDPNYVPLTYSNGDLEKLDFTRLYKPMTIDNLLKKLYMMHIPIV